MKTKTNGVFVKENNGWKIDTKVKVDGEWKHFTKRGFSTLADAKKAYENEKLKFKRNKESHHKVILFEDLIEQYKKMRSVTVNVTTLSCDDSIYNVYLFPYFKGKTISSVFTKEIIESWYYKIVNTEEYSQNKKSKVVTRMKDILKFAYMHEYIDAQAYQSCDVRLYPIKDDERTKTERIVWSKDEEDRFKNTIKEDYKDYIMFLILMETGTRIGELLGLQVKCFEYEKRRLIIMQQALSIVGKGSTLTDKLKTKDSYRTIKLSQETSDMLEEYITKYKLKENHFLFFTSNPRNPLSRTTFRKKLYYYCDKANVRKCNPHAMRHQQAVKLARVCMTGDDIETAAHRLGHSTSVFLDIYANHKNDEKEDELLSKMYC